MNLEKFYNQNVHKDFLKPKFSIDNLRELYYKINKLSNERLVELSKYMIYEIDGELSSLSSVYHNLMIYEKKKRNLYKNSMKTDFEKLILRIS